MVKRQKTLVILSPGFPQNEADTACIPPQQVFVKALNAGFPDIRIVVLSFEYPFKKARYNWNGVEVIAFAGKNRGKLYRLQNWLKVWTTLNRLNKTTEVIGLLSFWLGECALLGQYFAKTHRLKHYCWVLGQDAKEDNGYMRLMRPKGDWIVALSDFIARTLHKNYGIQATHIIPPGIDTAMFAAGGAVRDIDILGAGSLIPLKRYEIFIHAVNHITSYKPGVKAVICGKGPEKEALLALINHLNLSQNITLVDELPHAEVLALMQRSKVFLHPSEYEGFGAVLLEALYAGAQVVSFVKPMEQPISHHHVVNNIVAMQQTLVQILSDKNPDYTSVMVFPIGEIAARVMALYKV